MGRLKETDTEFSELFNFVFPFKKSIVSSYSTARGEQLLVSEYNICKNWLHTYVHTQTHTHTHTHTHIYIYIYIYVCVCVCVCVCMYVCILKILTSKIIFFFMNSLHPRITHSYLLEGKQQPMCYACQTKYTMKHILIECTDLAHIRKTFYSANNMKELFQNTEINNVVSFLKTVKLYTKTKRNLQ